MAESKLVKKSCLFATDDKEGCQSICDNLSRLLNTRLGMSYENYGLKSIEDYKRELISAETLHEDILSCIQYFEKRLTNVTLTSVSINDKHVFKRYQLKARYSDKLFVVDINVYTNGYIHVAE